MTTPFRTLIINPGSTSTKIAVYDDDQPLLSHSVEHPGEQLQAFERIADQFEMRRKMIVDLLAEKRIALDSLSAIAGRGGLLRSIPGGTYLVNDAMLTDLRSAERGEHASNLGALIGEAIARMAGCHCYIVDPVVVDELDEVSRFSGHPLLPRQSIFHALNQKRTARIVAGKIGKRYEEANVIVAHLGGGVSVGVHAKGRVIDVNNALDGEGAFSPERSGTLPAGQLVGLCFSGEYTEKQIRQMIKGKGGLVAYLGTHDMRLVEERIAQGDSEAEKVHSAMAMQVAKDIGQMATVVSGNVDAVALTGGIAYSKSFVDKVLKRINFIAEVFVIPGENEMEALRDGVLRVLSGEEAPLVY
jgi:butyrate kinase